MIKGKAGWDCVRLVMRGADLTVNKHPVVRCHLPCALLCPVPRVWRLPGLNSLVHHSSVVYEGGSDTAAQIQKVDGSDGLSLCMHTLHLPSSSPAQISPQTPTALVSPKS